MQDYQPRHDRISKKLTIRYLTALFLIAVTVSVSFGILQFLIKSQKDSAVLINIAGKQRMFSQRISHLADMVITAPDQQQAAVHQSLLKLNTDLMARAHAALSQGNGDYNLPTQLSSEISNLFFGSNYNVDRLTTEFLFLANELAEADWPLKSALQANQLRVHELAMFPLLIGYDRIVSQYQTESEIEVARLARIKTLAWALTLLVLMLEARFIFHPMVRYVLVLLKQAEAHRTALNSHIGELERAQEQLVNTEKMASLGRMVAGFAHELNTPTSIALGAITYSKQIVEAYPSGSDQLTENKVNELKKSLEESSDLALRNMERITELVERLQRTSANLSATQILSFKVSDLTNNIKISWHRQFQNYLIAFEADVGKDVTLSGQPSLLEDVLFNLIENSLSHAFPAPNPRNFIKLAIDVNSKNQLSIYYADNGSGMNQDQLKHIYEPFYTTDRQSGTGLGMFMVHNFAVNISQGSIQTTSVPGEGFQVNIQLPVQQKDGHFHYGGYRAANYQSD